jgi:hypothetical protein
MHNSKTEYRLCGVKVPRRWYRRLGRFVPELFRDVRSVPDGT